MQQCQHCGAPIEQYTRICPHCGRSRFEPPTPPKKPSSWLFKILSFFITLLIIAVIVSIGFLAMRFMNTDINFDFTPKKSDKALPHTKLQHVNVLSPEFSAQYMNVNRIEGYQGFKLNQTRDQIEQQFGKAEKTFKVGDLKVHQYGDIGVSYSNDRVNHVLVTPNNVSNHAFIAVHNRPDADHGHYWYYDKNNQNGYTIKVYVKDGHIIAIENIPQI